LEDLANYAIMTAMWLEQQVENMSDHVRYWDDDLSDEDFWDDHAEREIDWNDGWHDFEDDDDNDDIDAFLDMLSNFDSGEDTNEGTHTDYFNYGFDDDESED